MDNSQFNKGIIELCVLALIAQKDRYGYELIEIISKSVTISEGAVYPILRRLTKEGCFKTYLLESNTGPPRKYYKITKMGSEKAAEQVDEWTQLNLKINELIKGKKK